jgi:hypothetical protein
MRRLLEDTARQLRSTPRARTVPQPLPLVCASELAAADDILTLLDQSLQQTPLPLEISELRVTNDVYAIARGCLIDAELETQVAARRKTG